jgi:hypothetical protein
VIVQAGRYAKRSGFELMAHFPDFKAAMDARGATTAVQWNIAEHRTAFLDGAPLNGNLLLLLVAVAAPFCGALRAPREGALAAVAWLGVPASFSLLVWEPSWNHYFLQYVPPMALLSGYAFDAAWRRPALQGPAALAAAIVIYAGVTHPDTDREWYESVAAAEARAGAEEVFTFMPLYHVVAGTRAACGLVDPINVYGEQCAVSWAPDTPLYRFHVAPEDIIECLHPGVPVVIERHAFWFMDAQVIAHLAATPRRLFFLDDVDRDRFFSTARRLGAIAAPSGEP